MVLTAIVVHEIWGWLLIGSEAPLVTTPLANFPVRDQQFASLCYLIAALLALLPVRWPNIDHKHPMLGLFLTLPQQWLLMGSAWTGILCGWNGAYPDGYVPVGGAPFIWADQSWAIVGMIAHTFSLIDWYWFACKQK